MVREKSDWAYKLLDESTEIARVLINKSLGDVKASEGVLYYLSRREDALQLGLDVTDYDKRIAEATRDMNQIYLSSGFYDFYKIKENNSRQKASLVSTIKKKLGYMAK